MEWPARSPDMNIIENLWEDLARVYAKKRQLSNINELKECILVEWEKINQKRIEKLYKSLPRRMIAIMKNSGDSTKY